MQQYGRQKFAFFDVDETLINVKSMFSFQKFYLSALHGEEKGGRLFSEFWERIKKLSVQGIDRAAINAIYYCQFKGGYLSQMRGLAFEWFDSVKNQENFYVRSVVDRLVEHRENGQDPVFVSGSSVDILAPLAISLGVNYVLANKQSSSNDILDGLLIPPQTIGRGKAEAISIFLREKNSDPRSCVAYGDHISDVPMLESVGKAFVVGSNTELIALAMQNGWSIIDE